MSRLPSSRTLAAVAGVGALTAAYAVAIEPRDFRLRRLTVPVLAADTGPVRLLHLSDLHQTPRQAGKRAWLRDLARLSPDLTVVTGDLLGGVDAMPAVLDALEPLLGLPGAFVPGNNDYYAPRPANPLRYFSPERGPRRRGASLPWPELAAGLTAAGWLDLTHRRTVVEVGARVELVGTDDAHSHRARAELVRGPADPSAALTIGVTHSPQPWLLDTLAGDGARLLMAGHTHGGQVRLPGVGALVTNCELDTGRARGLSQWGEDGALLHVSAGVGASPYMPPRFGCPPEATLLTLVPREAGGGPGG